MSELFWGLLGVVAILGAAGVIVAALVALAVAIDDVKIFLEERKGDDHGT